MTHRCYEKDPRQRIRDIGDVRLAMEGAFETTVGAPSEAGVAPTLPVWLSQRPVTLAIVVLAALAVGGVAVWSLTRPAAQEAVARFSIPLGADQLFTANRSVLDAGRHLVALSPNGTQLV